MDEMTEMTELNELTDLDTLGVSLVNRGANRKKFAINKSETEINSMNKIVKSVMETPLDNEQEHLEELKKYELSELGKESLITMARISHAFKEEMPMEALKFLVKLMGLKLEEERMEEQEQEKEPEYFSVSEEGQLKFNEDFGMKEMPAGLREQLQSLWKSNQEAKEKLAVYEEIAKKQKEDQVTKEYVEKAEKLEKLPAKTEDIAEILKTIGCEKPELEEKIFDLLTKAHNLLDKESVVMKEIGSSKTEDSADSYEEIKKLAQKYKKELGHKISDQEAVSEILKTSEGKRLYKEMLNI